MTKDSLHPEMKLLIHLVDQAYEKKSWHGPNLRGSIRGLTAAKAGWRPRPDRHSIADIVVHCAYWKYAVRRRLCGEKRGSFAIAGSNWFTLPSRLSGEVWKSYVRLLEQGHRALRAAIAEFPASQLHATPPKSKVSNLDIIQGIAAHDLYHAGQIQLLKRLQDGK